jgi:hypothetical protein
LRHYPSSYRGGSCCKRCHMIPVIVESPRWYIANLGLNDAVLLSAGLDAISPLTMHPSRAALSCLTASTSLRRVVNTGQVL